MKNIYHAADDLILLFIVRCIISGYLDESPKEATN